MVSHVEVRTCPLRLPPPPPQPQDGGVTPWMRSTVRERELLLLAVHSSYYQADSSLNATRNTFLKPNWGDGRVLARTCTYNYYLKGQYVKKTSAAQNRKMTHCNINSPNSKKRPILQESRKWMGRMIRE